ncbi:MAG TPA: cysteine hydrolase family protein [Desulfuromonadales bacterium]|nr:cysteine hydrolase family protein [Desulfuromonadales bacterium]
MSRALLIIDIQNDYFPGGAMELVGSPEAGTNAGRLLAAFRAAGLPVAHIQHISGRPGATFFLPETEGAEIHPCVTPLENEPVFLKHTPNSFRDTGLRTHLQELGIDELTIAGMMTHMCVDTTVRAAFDLGFSCTLAHDACATRDLAFAGQTVAAVQVQTAYLAALGAVFAGILPTEEILADL